MRPQKTFSVRRDASNASVIECVRRTMVLRVGGHTRCVPTPSCVGLGFSLRVLSRAKTIRIFAEKLSSMPYDLPQRKSPRARWHNYTGADYFVTFCTKNRELFFGDVVNGKMELSQIGEYAVTQIEQTAIIRQNDVEIPMYVVMPNHIHLIVVYNRVDSCRDTPRVSALELSQSEPADARGASLQFGPQLGNLPSVVRGIKSAVTKYAIENAISFAWQPRYHDHIIRNQLEMNYIADYVKNNPMRWETDRFYRRR